MKVYDPVSLGLQVISISGVEAKLRCSFHYDKTPSARFNLEKGVYHCFGCGYSANAYQLAKFFDGEILKVELSAVDYEKDDKEWRQLLYSPLALKNRYLKSRKVTDNQIKKFNILHCDDGILFPIFDNKGISVGVQLRKYEGEPKYVLNGNRTPVWPMKNLRHENLLMVEGVFGVLRADLFGLKAVCTMGASAIPEAARALLGRRVKIMFDDDLAGYLGAYSFMQIHKDSEVILPGLEVDESSKTELLHKLEGPSCKDILKFAIDKKDKPLINWIKQKEAQYEKRKNKYSKVRARAQSRS
jgi:DNA primase